MIQSQSWQLVEGTWLADIFAAGTDELVGAMGDEWKDFPALDAVGDYGGRRCICD